MLLLLYANKPALNCLHHLMTLIFSGRLLNAYFFGTRNWRVIYTLSLDWIVNWIAGMEGEQNTVKVKAANKVHIKYTP